MCVNALRYKVRCPVCRSGDTVDVLELFNEPWHELSPDPPRFNDPDPDGQRRLACRVLTCGACDAKVTVALQLKEMVISKASSRVEDITPAPKPLLH